MATELQKKAFSVLVGKGGKISEAMREAKYNENTIHSPKKLTESKGFQELLDEAGLTDEFLNNALYDDIKAKKKNRKPELELAYKLKNKLTDKIEMEHSGDIDLNIKDTISKFYGKPD